MGSKPSGKQETRYAPYVEIAHQNILNNNGVDILSKSVFAAMNETFGRSPFGGAAVINVRDGFFSDGYQIESFPSLWDMFGKFMAGVDLHSLFDQTANAIIAGAPVNDLINTHAIELDDNIDMNVLPRFHAGMRNINAVQSSAFAVGRAIIEDSRIKAVNKFASEARIRAFDHSVEVWKKHLDWNGAVIKTYAEMFKLYYSTEMDVDTLKMDFQQRDVLFDLTLYEYARAVLGVVSGAQGTATPPGPSQAQKTIGGALSGAAVGAQVGGYWGAAVGAVVGIAASFL